MWKPPPHQKATLTRKLNLSPSFCFVTFSQEVSLETWNRELAVYLDPRGGLHTYPRDFVSKWMLNEALLDRRLKLLGHLARSKETLLKKYVLRKSGALTLQLSLVRIFKSKEEIICEWRAKKHLKG